ncbi:hypothetical protein PIB30_008619 [Stylosanthes scabra]|uniref:Uncharacterized protein n=1 Tax=Stylosanthes scabra TaxID=79078 RepID=A0ABU6R4L1_9FABA|nr:hypothetical protein [Stylosanthes scabra]
MTLKRQSFRLRIPWPFAPIGRPSAEPSRRSKDKTKSSKDSDTNVPIQRAPLPSPPPPPKTPLIEIHEKPTTTSVMIESSSVPSPSKSSTPFHTPPPSPSKSSTPFHTPSPSPLPHHSIESSSPKTPPKNIEKLATQETIKPASFSLEQEEEKKDESETKESSPSRAIIELPETLIRPNIMSIEPQESQQQESKTELASNQPPPPPLPPLAEQTGEALKSNAEERIGEEKEKIVEAVSELEPVPQETETKAESPLKTVPNSPQISTQSQEFEPQTSFKPSSPISKTEPTFDQPSPSSPLASEHLKPSIEESTLPPLLASQETESKVIPKSPKTSFHHEPTSDQSSHQEDKEKMELVASEAQPKEAEMKMKSPLKTIPQLPEASSRIENIHEMERFESKFDSHGAAKSSKASLKPQSKLLEPEEKEKEMHKHVKARKSKGIASNSGTKSNKDPFSGVFRPRRRTQQVVERNLMFATSKFMSSISPEKTALPKGIACDVSRFLHKLSTVEQSEVVTVAGDNRGATMQVGNSAEEAEPEDSTEVITDMEENTEKELTKDDEIGMAYVNSNIQSINNSVMVHGSIT